MSPVVGFARELQGHPAYLQSFSFSYAWLEAPLSARLARLSDAPDWQDLTVWPSGRLFGEAGEYRWQRIADGTPHAVLLLEDKPLPQDFGAGVNLRYEGESALILWGKWVDPNKDPQSTPDGGVYFYANEIPQVQDYPLDLKDQPKDDETPRLVIRRYRAVNGETGEFLRCVGFILKAREGEK